MIIPTTCLAVLVASTTLADVPTVASPREAPSARTLHVREAWRAGGDEDAEYLFGVIHTAVADPQGVVHLLDHQTQTIHAFGPDGDYRGVTARRGQGPGEIEMVYGLGMWDDRLLGCIKSFPGAVILVGTDGRPGQVVEFELAPSAGGTTYLSAHRFEHGRNGLVCSGYQYHQDESGSSTHHFLASFDDAGRMRHLFGRQATGYDQTRTVIVDDDKNYVPLERWTLGADDQVYVAPERNAYLIEVRDLDGTLLRRITRDMESRRRTAEDKEHAKRDYTFTSNGGELPEVRYDLADHEALLQGLAWRDGLLWVSTRQGWESGYPAFDIYDRTGRLVEERRYDVPWDMENDTLLFLPEGRIVRITNLMAAYAAATADMQVQVGDDPLAAPEDEDLLHEVIVYEVVGGGADQGR